MATIKCLDQFSIVVHKDGLAELLLGVAAPARVGGDGKDVVCATLFIPPGPQCLSREREEATRRITIFGLTI